MTLLSVLGTKSLDDIFLTFAFFLKHEAEIIGEDVL